jgi:hypothetical protein
MENNNVINAIITLSHRVDTLFRNDPNFKCPQVKVSTSKQLDSIVSDIIVIYDLEYLIYMDDFDRIIRE